MHLCFGEMMVRKKLHSAPHIWPDGASLRGKFKQTRETSSGGSSRTGHSVISLVSRTGSVRSWLLLLLLAWLSTTEVEGQINWTPWDNFDKSVVVRTNYGEVRGFSVPWHVDDEYWREEWQEQPLWYQRRINCFLGVPYAEPPVGRYRFERSRRPRWSQVKPWDASFFRPACPQDLNELRKDIPDATNSHMSEDCLYMNIFVPNVTWHSVKTRYPVMVFIHGGDFLHGSAEIHPGHVLATKGIAVVTFNYRLGALGWLTTEDQHGAGNWGLWDQHLAIEFVKDNIDFFRGDKNRITLAGEGAGAASVGLHIISPITRQTNKFFHQGILMDGSDLSPFAYINPFWRPREYAAKFGRLMGCDPEDSYLMMECLRNNKTKPWESIVRSQSEVLPNDGELGFVWGPVQDGGYYNGPLRREEYLPETPHDLRMQELFARIPILAGLNAQSGARLAEKIAGSLCSGMFKERFEQLIGEILVDWRIQDLHRQRAIEALTFQYTYWPDPSNITAQAQEFIKFVTDYEVGVGLDTVIKQHAAHESSYFYVFDYDSWNDYLPHCLGNAESAALPYVFGVPFMNETVLNETHMIPRQWYDYDERNMSDFMMYMWTNFVKDQIPTPNITRNITWEPFNDFNRSFLFIDYYPRIWFDYRQQKYGFWRDYFPGVALQNYYYPTATPTPIGQEYVYASGGMAALLFVLILILAVCIYLLIQQSRDEEVKAAYADSQVPLSFSRGSESISNVSRRSPYNYEPSEGGDYSGGGRNTPMEKSGGYTPSGYEYSSRYAPSRGATGGRQSPHLDMSGYSQYHQSDV